MTTKLPKMGMSELRGLWKEMRNNNVDISVEEAFDFLTDNPHLLEDERAFENLDMFEKTLKRNNISPYGSGPKGVVLEDPETHTFERKAELYFKSLEDSDEEMSEEQPPATPGAPGSGAGADSHCST